MLEQWLGIGQPHVRLKASLDKVVGLPWVNTVAADRAGNTLYADASVVPHVRPDKFAGDCLAVPAAARCSTVRAAACGWGRDPGTPAGHLSRPGPHHRCMRTDYVATPTTATG